ncbi:LysR family transcriptional regulator [Ferrimonas lipolytica]|uniref:LysR family transcriptional regulator n=1 Tax=Ferrimonas lipolytica TaxID=2724191 RepID=A0A6H1UFM8_9GAMM|nr:LysR family transcriptional regulator [Ferrimonas lipolytica]QIZ77628.1 LysR family transcriptional regulator [Ferrimonas lipolytica]
MKSMQALRIFVETARLGSLSAAARLLELSPAVSSAAVKRLEQELGHELFVRSTRQLRLTQQGERFLISAQQALDLIEDGVAAVRDNAVDLSGQISISAPSDFGRNLLSPWLAEFMQLHPHLTIRLHLNDSLTDLYRQPVDLMLRYGQPNDSSLVALPLTNDNVRILCASPAYITAYGEPQSPHQLTQHNCLCFALDSTTFNKWQLHDNQQALSIKVSGDRIANDGELVHRWALAGYGVAFKSIVDIYDDLQSGKLIRLCHSWQSRTVPLNLLCASRSQLNPTIRALQQFLSMKIKQRID